MDSTYYALSAYTSPKYFSKKLISLSIMLCFLAARLTPPKRDTGGRILSMSVPVVFRAPSRKAISNRRRVSASFSFSPAIRLDNSSSFRSCTKLCQSSSMRALRFTRSTNCSISSFLLRSSRLELIALPIAANMLLSWQLESWYFSASIRI